MLDEGYVYNRNGCFFPDVKLRSRIFMSRIKKGQERFKEKKEEIKEFSKQTKYIPQKFWKGEIQTLLSRKWIIGDYSI